MKFSWSFLFITSMSGAIYDPSVDVIDTMFQVSPVTGSIFVVSGSVDSNVTGSVAITNWPSIQTITGNINTTTIPQTSSQTLVYKITSSLISTTVLSENSNRKGATFYKEGGGIAYLLLGTGSASSANYTVKLSIDTFYETSYNYVGQAKISFSSTAVGSFVTVTEFI